MQEFRKVINPLPDSAIKRHRMRELQDDHSQSLGAFEADLSIRVALSNPIKRQKIETLLREYGIDISVLDQFTNQSLINGARKIKKLDFGINTLERDLKKS